MLLFFLNSKHWLSITVFGLFLSTCQRNEIRSRNCVSHSPGLGFQNHGKTNIDYSVAKHENSCKMQVQRSRLFVCPLFKEIPRALILINRIFCCSSFCFFDTQSFSVLELTEIRLPPSTEGWAQRQAPRPLNRLCCFIY